MAQFDVCRNGGRSRAGFPYLVIVQSRIFDCTARRLVVCAGRPAFEDAVLFTEYNQC